jgi:hypothetical protein
MDRERSSEGSFRWNPYPTSFHAVVDESVFESIYASFQRLKDVHGNYVMERPMLVHYLQGLYMWVGVVVGVSVLWSKMPTPYTHTERKNTLSALHGSKEMKPPDWVLKSC